MEVRPNEVIWTVEVATQGLEKVLKLPADALKLTEPQLQEVKRDIVAYLLESLKAEINGVSVEAEPGTTKPVYDTLVGSGEKYISYARQQLSVPGSWSWDWLRAMDGRKRARCASC